MSVGRVGPFCVRPSREEARCQEEQDSCFQAYRYVARLPVGHLYDADRPYDHAATSALFPLSLPVPPVAALLKLSSSAEAVSHPCPRNYRLSGCPHRVAVSSLYSGAGFESAGDVLQEVACPKES